MRVLVELESGDLVEFEINEVGVIGTGNYFLEGEKSGVPIKPSVSDIKKWLNKGKIIDIRFRDDNEKRALVHSLIEYGKVRSLIRCRGFWRVISR